MMRLPLIMVTHFAMLLQLQKRINMPIHVAVPQCCQVQWHHQDDASTDATTADVLPAQSRRKAEQEKCRLEELKEECEERRLEQQQHHQTMLMMMMAMRGGDLSKVNFKNDNQSD
jgi:hypothetical protein